VSSLPASGRPAPSVGGRALARFATALIRHDLPQLDEREIEATTRFVVEAHAGMPDVSRHAISLVAAAVHGALALRLTGGPAGRAQWAVALARRPPPVVADYVRLIRSLAITYAYEQPVRTCAPAGGPR
jgi:hypothetical protein